MSLKVPLLNSFRRRPDQALSDSIADFDPLALEERAIANSHVNLFDGDPLLGLTPTDVSGVSNLTADISAGAALGSKTASTASSSSASTSLNVNALPAVTIADGASIEIVGAGAPSITFTGTSGTLKLDHSLAFTGQVSGLAGSDALDLADVSYGPNTTATFLGNTTGGTLTITDGTHTADVALQGDYLSSTWTLSSDGNGGTVVVDPVPANAWQNLDIGGGGQVTGIDIAPDDTMVIRCDSYGAYIWNGTQWQQLVTSTSMPAAFVTPTHNSITQGVYEVQVAPSNSNILYMEYEGYVFQSTNKGTTWTQTSFAPVTGEDAADGTYKFDGQKMAIDPNNANVVVVGTPENGLFITTNGGASWQSVSGVPLSLPDSSGDNPGFSGIVFDPALGVTAGRTNTIFAASYGNGVYKSTDGGTSWSSIGGPSDVQYAAVSSTGVYYAINAINTANSSLWKYQNGTWTQLYSDSNGISTVAVDPFNSNEIVTQDMGGMLRISYDAGVTWSSLDNGGNSVVSTDIPWLATASNNTVAGGQPWLTTASTVFDQVTPNKLWSGDGTGVYYTTNVPTANFQWNTPVVWNDQSVGIEQLVASEIIVPPGGNPVVASWDRPFFDISDPSTYPSAYSPWQGQQLSEGFSIDYASSNPSFLVGLADNWGRENSGYSTDGGQTWTVFPSFPTGAASSFIGGTIAASTPTDIVWAPAGGVQPYYTLNGGTSWNPITLPGVSSWSGFDWSHNFDTRTVTADRVLPNTFYLYYAGQGVFETTNGGATWTKVFSGQISANSQYNATLESVPGQAGNLFFTGGWQSNMPSEQFYRSTNGGATWTAVPNVTEVNCFGFGAAAPGQSYPSIYIVGWVNNVYGIWQSNNDAQSWTQIGTYPNGDLDLIQTISGDPNTYGQVYVGFSGSGYAYLSADPLVTAVSASPSSGIETLGNTITLTLTMSEAVTVTGTPTLSLNDGGTATYSGGSGTSALTFSYTVSAGDRAESALAITQANFPNGATIADATGNGANLSAALTTFSGLQIDPPNPGILSIVETPSSGALGTGGLVTLTLNLNHAVTVAGGTPTLTLNDGGTATYTGGSGTSALTFGYTVGTGQNTASLAATAVNLNGATISNGTGNAANLSLTGLTQTGPLINTVMSIDGKGFFSSYGGTSAKVTLTTAQANDVIILNIADNGTTVSSVSDTAGLTWHQRAVAAGSGTQPLYQYYAIAPSALSADAITVNFTGTASFDALDVFGISGANTSSPFDSTATSNTSTVSTTTSNANDLIFAAYRFSNDSSPSAGAGWTTLNNASGAYYLSEYQIVGATQAGLVATASTTDQSGGIITAVVQAAAPSGPILSSVVESPSSGDLNAGTVTLTLNLSSAVTVAGGTPTLTLNDGGIATYTGGSGSNALTFSYTIGAGQNAAALAATAVNLNGAAVTDGSGNPANFLLTGLTQAGPQVDTTTPVISAISESPANGDLSVGKIVTYTITMSEAVTVNTTGGSPTLTFNDGGTGTYASGSGTSALTFSYTVLAGQNTPDLMVSAFNLNGATLLDGAGNAANLSLTGVIQGSPQIDTTPPSVTQVIASPANGTEFPGNTVTFTLAFGETVTVTGTPTLTLNDGGTATYLAGNGTNALTFTYTVGSGDATVPSLAITHANLPNGATITDGAGNAANLSGALATFPNLTIGVDQAPVVTTSTQYMLRNQTIAASSLFTATDPDGTPIKTYALKDPTGFGYFVVNGVIQASNTEIDLTAAQLAQTTYVSGTGSEQLSVRASDGILWSSWQTVSVDVAAPKQKAPIVTASSLTTLAGQTFKASSLFSVSDPNGDAIVTYALKDTTGNGHFVVNGVVQASNTEIDLTAAQLAQTTFVAGSATDQLSVRASDGWLWSNWQSPAVNVSPTSVINGGATLELASAYPGTVTFASTTGTLKLDNSASFAGTVAGMSGSDTLDLADINFATIRTPTFNGNSTGGVLTVTDGSHTANIALMGNYIAATFATSSDSHGGTFIVDSATSSPLSPSHGHH